MVENEPWAQQYSPEQLAELRRMAGAEALAAVARFATATGEVAAAVQARPLLDVPVSLVRRPDAEGGLPTLVALLGPGRGWQRATIAKVHLVLSWLGTAPVTKSPRAVDVDETTLCLLAGRTPDAAGRRAIGEAVATLRAAELLHQDRLEPTPIDAEERNFSIGSAFITSGWLYAMPGAALLVHLIMASRPQGHQIWIASSRIQDWHGVSHAVFIRGARWLTERGLQEPIRRPANPDKGQRRTTVSWRATPEVTWFSPSLPKSEAPF